jgi:hypothetical protein
MNKPLIKKWVKALRSGKYKQVKNYLATDKGYCCLGVLCEVAIKQGIKLKRDSSGTSGIVIYDDQISDLPTRIRKHVGLAPKDVGELIGLNDIAGKSFEQIADYIEKL